MLTTRFGIEIEFTGITRARAAEVAASFLNGSIERAYDSYDSYKIHLADGRHYKVMSDGKDINPPGRYYYNIIRQGYLDCGFDTDVLTEALKHSVKTEDEKDGGHNDA